jgi:hypothetical protein
MTDLADVLELMHTSSERWDSLRLVGHEWRHHETLHRAFERHIAELGGQTSRVIAFRRLEAAEEGAGYKEPEEGREEWRVWLTKPDKTRTQFQVGIETVTAIFIGDRWWSRSPSRYVTNEGDPKVGHGRGPQEALIDTAPHVGSLRLQVDKLASFLSRPAYFVTAMLKDGEPHGFNPTLHMLGIGAELYRLVVDAKLGILLRTQAELEGVPFRIVEVDELAVDEQLDETLFDPFLLRSGPIDS